MDPLFELRGVTVHRGASVMLEALDLSVCDSGITVLSGASGTGKSTVLRLCNRLLAPTVGSVLFRGRDVSEMDPRALRRDVGMVFQHPTPFPGTVLDNLRTAVDLDRDTADALLHDVALDDSFLERDARELSGGEQQRVCLARTLSTDPQALLVDEGTSALDASATATLEALVMGLARGGRPVLWVTHDVHQAERIADHRLTLDRAHRGGHSDGGADGGS